MLVVQLRASHIDPTKFYKTLEINIEDKVVRISKTCIWNGTKNIIKNITYIFNSNNKKYSFSLFKMVMESLYKSLKRPMFTFDRKDKNT